MAKNDNILTSLVVQQNITQLCTQISNKQNITEFKHI